MFYVLQNESTAARRRVPILLTDAATGTTAQSGVALTNIYAYVNINGGAFIGGTGTKGEAGYGQYYYEYEANEVATLGLSGIHITAAGCRDYDAISQIAAFNLYSASTGASAADVWSYAGGRTITGGIADTVTTLTNRSGFAITGGTITTVSDKTGYSLSASQTFDITGNITGSVGSVTNPVTFDTAQYSGIASSVWTYATRTITGGIADTVTDVTNGVIVTTNNDKTGYSLSSTQTFDLTGNVSGSVGSVTADVNVSTASMTGIAGTVWSTDVSGFTSPSAGYDLTQAASGAGLTSGDVSVAVWDSPVASYTTSGTFGLNVLRSDIAGVAGTVSLWTGGAYSGVYADTYRIDEDYNAAIALKDILTGIGSSITANITGDLSGSVGSVTADVNVATASMTGIAGTVWNTDVSSFTSPSAGYDLTQAALGGGGVTAYAVAQEVWNTDVSSFTSPSAGFDLANASAGGGITAGAVADAVWTAQVATYATAGSNETLGTDTYGQKIARTVNINRPISINTANAVVVGSMSNGAITATAIASNAITEAKFATDALTSRIIAADAITSAELAPSANTEIADAVWAYATRNITGGTITTNNDKTGYSLSGSQTFNLTGDITGNLSGSVGSVTSGVTVTTNNDKSGYSVSTLDSGSISAASFLAGAIDAAALASDAVTEISNGVWSVAGRTITGGTITTNNDKTGYSLSGTQSFNLTGNITGNLSGSVGSVTAAVGVATASMTGIAGTVWSVASRTITGGTADTVSNPVSVTSLSMSGIANTVWSTDVSSYTNPSAGYSLSVAGSGGVSAADVWSYNGGRTITGGGTSAYDVWNFDPTAMTVPQAGAILTDIQTDTNTIITDISNIPNNVWASDVSGYSTPGEAGFELTQAAAGTALTTGDIWSYATRTITGGIADTVTSVTNPVTVGTNNDKTGYSLSSTQTFDLTGNITGNLSGSVGSVTNPVTFSSGQYAAIASSVWNAGTRTLTSGGSGISAYEVWNFNTRTLTSGSGITVNAATNIINGPYFVKSNVDGQDGSLDVIRGMVQDIQLTVTDANQNPFDTTSLGLAVNFYDQAGTLVTSYGTTELYGPAGLVQFTLDTVVTNTEGRYNLILSAAGAGNTIKFGPLQTLVRPF